MFDAAWSCAGHFVRPTFLGVCMAPIPQEVAAVMLATLTNLLRSYDRLTAVGAGRVDDATSGPGTLVKVPDSTAVLIRELIAQMDRR